MLTTMIKDLPEYKSFMKIGEGSFSVVYKARSKQNATDQVAIKQINLVDLEEGVYDYIQKEIELMKNSKNENIIKFVDCFEGLQYLYIIMELCTMDLDKLWKEYFDFSMAEKYVIAIIRQILNGFAYLHQNKVIHRDIKLENIFLNFSTEQLNKLKKRDYDVIYNGVYKIGDLGLAKQLDSGAWLTSTYAGSPLTMAPEVLERKEYGIKADMYSLGVIMYTMLFGTYPFMAHGTETQQEAIKRQDTSFEVENKQVSQTMQELLTNMLQYDSDKRLEWIDLYNHKFFSLRTGNLASRLDLQAKRNKTIYKNLKDQKFTREQVQARYNSNQPQEKIQQTQQFQQQVQQGQKETIIEMDDEEIEFIDMPNPTTIYLSRLYHRRNKSILLYRASVSVIQLKDQLGLEEQFLYNANFLYNISSQVHHQLKHGLQKQENILKVPQKAWNELVLQNEFKDLFGLVENDSKLFNQQPTEAKIKKQQQNYITELFGFTRFLNRGLEIQSIDSMNFNLYYQEFIISLLDQLQKTIKQDIAQTSIRNIKLCMVNTLNIWFVFDCDDPIYQDERQQDVELELEWENEQTLDLKLKKLSQQAKYKLM